MKMYYIKSKITNHYLKEEKSGHKVMTNSLKEATQFSDYEVAQFLLTWNDCYKCIEVKK